MFKPWFCHRNQPSSGGHRDHQATLSIQSRLTSHGRVPKMLKQKDIIHWMFGFSMKSTIDFGNFHVYGKPRKEHISQIVHQVQSPGIGIAHRSHLATPDFDPRWKPWPM